MCLLFFKYMGGVEHHDSLLEKEQKRKMFLRGLLMWGFSKRMYHKYITCYRKTTNIFFKEFCLQSSVSNLKLGRLGHVSRMMQGVRSYKKVLDDVKFGNKRHLSGKPSRQRRCQYHNGRIKSSIYCVKCNTILCVLESVKVFFF